MLIVSQPSTRNSGFTLIESLIGLTLLAAILLATASLLATVPREVRRVEARREATRALEAALESLRAGQLPIATGIVDAQFYGWTQPPRPAAAGLRLWLRTEPISPPGLYRVTVRARYSIHHRPQERSIETLAWRP